MYVAASSFNISIAAINEGDLQCKSEESPFDANVEMCYHVMSIRVASIRFCSTITSFLMLLFSVRICLSCTFITTFCSHNTEPSF